MKVLKLFLVAILLLTGLQSIGICANNELTPYTVSLSTYASTDATNLNTDISGTAYIRMIWITNTGEAAQQVTFYENSTSTTAITTTFVIDIASGTVTPICLEFDENPEYWKADNVLARKNSTSSTVRVTYWYW